MNIGIVIKQFRKERNWSQNELGHKCGWEQGRVSHYETGRRSPSLADLSTLAGAFNVPIQALVSGESLGDPKPTDETAQTMTEQDQKDFADFKNLSESNRDLVRNLIASLEAGSKK